MASSRQPTTGSSRAARATSEVDGEIIPDYDADPHRLQRGGHRHRQGRRIDKDEVLVDIGYKSEGVIPVNELSIRRNVNTADEVSSTKRSTPSS